ncbi:hypothetical protein MSG28_004875 [Choristoneura fumiferana]|uniref:Uncharacterized protein n=1 Tax=Choristoneura fumiferana TaxID=7141 RepID=A0ACC0K7Y4_CHOFU|nr:hypothetical protein MSG28_004875 [Choristoneura fumiferana]
MRSTRTTRRRASLRGRGRRTAQAGHAGAGRRCRRALPERRRTPSPASAASRKSSFCSLFKSREPAASPDSPSTAVRRKKSLNEGRERSKSRERERSATPTSAAKLRGSVLALFRTPRRSTASPSPSERASSPNPPPAPAPAERRKYYEETGNVIHIPLRTPPDERPGPSGARPQPVRPASAPQPTPDGSIIIPLHSPTERAPAAGSPAGAEPLVDSGVVTLDSRRSVTTSESRRSVVTPESRRSPATSESRQLDDSRNGDARTESSSDEGRPAAPAAGSPAGDDAAGRKRRLVFSTHVGSRDQVFCTQFSITKTPSVTSEISGSIPSFPEPPPLRDTHIAAEPAPAAPPPAAPLQAAPLQRARAASPPPSPEAPRDSSESEPSSGAATPAARGGSDAEQRVLVVQESFEDELPYVPTTLPLERPLALPMVPVRERGPRAATAGVRRPRAAGPLPPAPLSAPRAAPRGPLPPAPLPALPAAAGPLPPAPLPAPPAAGAEKLRIKLPRRPRTASASAPPRPDRPRTRSGGDGDSRTKTEWIDFEEVPERRKQPKRIQTLPGGAAGAADAADAAERGVVFNYVEPEQCRCELLPHPDPMAGYADEQSVRKKCTTSCHSTSMQAHCLTKHTLTVILRVLVTITTTLHNVPCVVLQLAGGDGRLVRRARAGAARARAGAAQFAAPLTPPVRTRRAGAGAGAGAGAADAASFF